MTTSTPNGSDGTTAVNADGVKNEAGTSAEFDSWMAQQSEDVRKKILDWHESQTKPLKNAHERGKTERAELKAELERIRKDKTLDADAKATAIQAELDKASRKAAFFEGLPPEITDRSAAMVLAEHDGLIRPDGSCDFAKLKELHPALFTVIPNTPGFAGKGTGQKPKPAMNMNRWMRQQVHRSET